MPFVGSCGAVSPCVHERLDDWCLHSEVDDGPIAVESEPGVELACPEPPEPNMVCDNGWEVNASSGGFTSQTFFYRDDELRAVRYTTDVNGYCGGFEFWYGRRAPTCDPI
jgi:hypothetical protein